MQDISLTTRAGAGQALTWQQMDANWTTLQAAVNALIDAGYITAAQAQALITGAAVLSALGFTPYNASNPNGFQTAAQVNAAIQAVVGAAPAALATLQAIDAQMSSDESAAAALTTVVGAKANNDLSNLVALNAATIASLKTQLGVASNGAKAIAGRMANYTPRSIAASTFTKVLFDTVVFDSNNLFNNSRVTPTVAGYYYVQGKTFTNSSVSYLPALITKNGATYSSGDWMAASVWGMSGSGIVYCNGTTDYFEIYTFSSPAAILDGIKVTASYTTNSFFEFVFLGS